MLFLEPVVSFYPQIVDLRLTHNLQEKVPACPKTGVEDSRQRTGPKRVVAQHVEEIRSTADERQSVDRICAVIELSAHLHDHALVDIKSGLGNLLHVRAPCARIEEAKRTNGS